MPAPLKHCLVVARFRPMTKKEIKKSKKINNGGGLELNDKRIKITLPQGTKGMTSLLKQKGEIINCDHVFGPSSTQPELYSYIGSSLVRRAIEGYNTACLAYGQTNAGKTFTMFGTGVHLRAGLIPRMASDIFNRLDGIDASVKVGFFELYNEEIRDLLNPKLKKQLDVREMPNGRVAIVGLRRTEVHNVEQFLELIRLGLSLRQTSTTKRNEFSSRSHTILKITIHIRDPIKGGTIVGRITMADLAGAEPLKSNNNNTKESIYINKSISTLYRCAVSAAEGNVDGLRKHEQLAKRDNVHIPFRESKLTYILREHLSGQSITSIILNCSPSATELRRTYQSLQFGINAKKIPVEAKKNEIHLFNNINNNGNNTSKNTYNLNDSTRSMYAELSRRKSNTGTRRSSTNNALASNRSTSSGISIQDMQKHDNIDGNNTTRTALSMHSNISQQSDGSQISRFRDGNVPQTKRSSVNDNMSKLDGMSTIASHTSRTNNEIIDEVKEVPPIFLELRNQLESQMQLIKDQLSSLEENTGPNVEETNNFLETIHETTAEVKQTKKIIEQRKKELLSNKKDKDTKKELKDIVTKRKKSKSKTKRRATSGTKSSKAKSSKKKSKSPSGSKKKKSVGKKKSNTKKKSKKNKRNINKRSSSKRGNTSLNWASDPVLTDWTKPILTSVEQALLYKLGGNISDDSSSSESENSDDEYSDHEENFTSDVIDGGNVRKTWCSGLSRIQMCFYFLVYLACIHQISMLIDTGKFAQFPRRQCYSLQLNEERLFCEVIPTSLPNIPEDKLWICPLRSVGTVYVPDEGVGVEFRGRLDLLPNARGYYCPDITYTSREFTLAMCLFVVWLIYLLRHYVLESFNQIANLEKFGEKTDITKELALTKQQEDDRKHLYELQRYSDDLVIDVPINVSAELLGAEIDADTRRNNIIAGTQTQTVPSELREPWIQNLILWQESKKRHAYFSSLGLNRRAMAWYTFFTIWLLIICQLVLGIVPEFKEDFVEIEPLDALPIRAMLAGKGGLIFWLNICVTVYEVIVTLFMVLMVRWPRIKRSSEVTAHEDALDNRRRAFRTCVLVACHQSCLTDDRTRSFTRVLKQLLKVFPPENIFVCDNGNALYPTDDTQVITASINPRLRYLYIPEGNKSMSVYWTVDKWIPHIDQLEGGCNFDFAIQMDDDVPIADNMEVAERNHERMKNVHAWAYGIQAAWESGDKPGLLVSCQDFEYKLAGMGKLFQANFGTTMWAHGAISCWRYQTLGKIMFEHDTMFHGDDMYMGKKLHDLHENSQLKFKADRLTDTYVPENWIVLARQRIYSWDLCAARKLFTYLEMTLFWWGKRGLLFKPFVIMEAGNLILDYFRPFLLTVGIMHYPRQMISLIIAACSLMWILSTIIQLGAFRARPELRQRAIVVLIFPTYRMFMMIVRIMACIGNAIHYVPWVRNRTTIRRRTEEFHDIPPVPPVARPDWSNIYTYDTSPPSYFEDKTNHLDTNLNDDDSYDETSLYSDQILNKSSKSMVTNANFTHATKEELRSMQAIFAGALIMEKLRRVNELCNISQEIENRKGLSDSAAFMSYFRLVHVLLVETLVNLGTGLRSPLFMHGAGKADMFWLKTCYDSYIKQVPIKKLKSVKELLLHNFDELKKLRAAVNTAGKAQDLSHLERSVLGFVEFVDSMVHNRSSVPKSDSKTLSYSKVRVSESVDDPNVIFD